MLRHPCFDERAHRMIGRLHLPVAPKCNLLCAYCERRFPCVSENRPGISKVVIKPEEVEVYVGQALKIEPKIEVLGIAGPGDPLANEETFEALARVKRAFPHLRLCLSTNGLLLPETLGRLLALRVEFLTITINASTVKTASKLYLWVRYQGKRFVRKEGARLVLKKQFEGLKLACEAGLKVKVNTVLVPGLNDQEVEDIAQRARLAGARIMNLIPLIPLGRLRKHRPPSAKELLLARRRAACYLPQFLSCKRCRADALGIPAEGDKGLCLAC